MGVLVRLDPSHVGSRVVVRHRLPGGSATDVLGELLRLDAAGLAVRADRGSAAGTVVEVAAADVLAARPVSPPPGRSRALGPRTGP